MRDFERRLLNLKRPKHMIDLAQNGLAHYNSQRHLPSLIGAQTTLGPNGTLYCLFQIVET